ncbi:MAG: outer membrane beta-barrel protein [Pedobacter sp.]|uniref:outer membrane beta-barrel protein n=1 Tax=Pedobacter sp. TaxID=1411316 RepID=UPI003562ADB6
MKRFLIGLLCTIPVLSFAQANFQKGYVITNSKDTLKGYIDYKERSKNPVNVDFRTSLNSSTQTYSLGNCAGYGIDDIEHQRRFAVNVSMSKIDVANLSYGPDSSFTRKTVFLKVLQDGKNLTLFSYEDDVKERYYMMSKDHQEPVELIRNTYLSTVKTNAIVNDNMYVRQLLAQMMKSNPGRPIEEKDVSNLEYTERKLLKFVSAINNQEPPKSKYKGFRFFAGAALSVSSASYRGLGELASEDAISKISYSPMLNGGIDLLINPAIGKLIFRTEISFMMDKYGVSVPDYIGNSRSHTFDRASLVLTPQFIYNIYNTNKLKFFAGFGAGLNFSKISNNKIVVTRDLDKTILLQNSDREINKFNYSLQLSTGVVLNKKIEVFAGYSPKAPITDYYSVALRVQRLAFGVNYLFGKH